MVFDPLITYFMPAELRHDKTHPRYTEFRVIIVSVLLAIPLMFLFPVFLWLLKKPVLGYFINDAMLVCMLISIRLFGHYRIPMTITALATYWIIYDWTSVSGYIYSPAVGILHIYLLAAIWVDPKYGWWAIFGNLGVFGYIYYETLHAGMPTSFDFTIGGPLYAFGMNCLITVFFGGFLAYHRFDQARDRAKIRALQEQKISMLDDAVKTRTEQLNSMRETLATDFHDETGNMLSAITRQASLLKIKVIQRDDLQLIVDSIIKNSKRLYASSKDFLWQLNHNSDDPGELFDYLTGYGQVYYNQFDIAFSSNAEPCHQLQFDPSAALNLIFIFKEAMTNVTEHSGATEVYLTMTCQPQTVCLTLQDNGTWKTSGAEREHYGLGNIEKRCKRNGFTVDILKASNGTTIRITAPVNSAMLT